MVAFDQEANALNAVPRDERTSAQIERSIALGAEMQMCQKAIKRVPRNLDPATLEWRL